MEAEEAEGMDGDYVYDLYAAVSGDEDEDEDGEQGGGQTAAWRELHAGGHAPIVQASLEGRGMGRAAAAGRAWAWHDNSCCSAELVLAGLMPTPPTQPPALDRSLTTTPGWWWRQGMPRTAMQTARTPMPRVSTPMTTQVRSAGGRGWRCRLFQGAWAGGLAGSFLRLDATAARLYTSNLPPACPALPADEPTDVDSSDDGGYDPEGSTFHRVRRGGGSEASYGYGGDSD